MIAYFGYGSNLNLIALKAKGVIPERSMIGRLFGWQLKFNVQHWFLHEGGMGNVVATNNNKDCVEGMVHFINENHLRALDTLESYGVGYDRIEIEVQTESGPIKALTYVGLPAFINDSCLPTQRYINIIIEGATIAGLSHLYIQKLKKQTIFELPLYPQFVPPFDSQRTINFNELSQNYYYTALAGYVFDMKMAREKLQAVIPLFGKKDMTLFHLKRHDSSSGNETLESYLAGNITEGQTKYINAYLNEYNREFEFVGTISYQD